MERDQDINKRNGKVCFVITPIGKANSEIRKRSDKVFKHIITPAVQECGYKPIRADRIPEPGIITSQIIKYLVESPFVIADLTSHNANVFFELAIRYATAKPTVQIIEEGEEIPFDVAVMRTIQVNTKDVDNLLDNIEEAKKKIIDQIKEAENLTEINNPVSSALIQQTLQSKGLLDLVKALANLEFDEKLAVMAGYKEKSKKAEDLNFEKIKNDFRAVSNLKMWVDPKKREELIVNYIIPIIEYTIQKEEIIGDGEKAQALDEMIKIALEYDIKTNDLKNLKEEISNK